MMGELISVIHPQAKHWGQQLPGQEACACMLASGRTTAAALVHPTSAFVLKYRDNRQ